MRRSSRAWRFNVRRLGCAGERISGVLAAARAGALVATLAATASAQGVDGIPHEDAIVARGTRVRVMAFDGDCYHARSVSGVVDSVRQDTLILLADSHAAWDAVPLRTIRRFQVSRGWLPVERRILHGGGLGLLAGLVGGVAVSYTRSSRLGDPRLESREVLAGVGAGALVGAVVGTLRPAERWRTVPLPAHIQFAAECPALTPVRPFGP